MSSIVIRNIVGTGAFAPPTTQDNLDTLNDSIKDIVGDIPNFRCLSARGDIISVDGSTPEVIAIIETFTYNGLIVPSASDVRTTITNAFLADPNITSIGNVEIKFVQEGGFYNSYPEIERVDDTANATVYFTKEAPLGAQIEVYKYTPHYTGDHPSSGSLGPYTSRLGKRYRPDQLLPVGATSISLGHGRLHSRCHFRFAYRWAVPDNSGGPGIRGPLSTTTVSTAVPKEREQLTFLIINPAPSGFNKYRP